jgi:hypothetical protein
MNDQPGRIAALLQEASETHHTVYRITDGDDPDWASWYADWLVNLSELPQLLETTPVRSELTWLLVSLDREYARTNPGPPWPQWVRGPHCWAFPPYRAEAATQLEAAPGVLPSLIRARAMVMARPMVRSRLVPGLRLPNRGVVYQSVCQAVARL